MAITVKHLKVSTIPDGDDTSLVRPSDWNEDHVLTGTVPVSNGGTGADTLTGYVKGNGTSAMTASTTIPNTDITGLGTMSTQDANNVNITGGSISGATVSGYIPTTEKAQPLGVATLDAGGKVPTSQIPQMGDLNYQGTWNASTNTPTLTSSTGTKGYYYVVSVAGTTNLDGVTDWLVGDWAVFNGSVWEKIDNTDAVTSVNGYTGTVVLTYTDVGAFPATATTGAGNVVLQTNPTVYNPNIDVIDFDTTYATTLTAGQLGWDGNNTLGLGMYGGNVIQHIGEDQFFYCKATSAITKGQVVMFTGAIGASGVSTGAPATGITDGTYIMGIAAESIALNGFGLVQSFGTLRNVNTTGYADGDILWYNPAVAGGLTKTKPVAPNVKVQMAAVINGGSSGGGTILIRIDPGSTLGGSDSNAQITTPVNGNLLTYDGADGYWKNTDLTAGTAISVSKSANGVLTVANTAPDQVVSLTGAGTTAVTGTYPNFTITSNDQYTGTVTSVAASAGTGISVSGSPITTSGTLTITNTGVTSAVAGTGISVSGSTGAVTVTNTAPDQTVAIASGTGISVTGTYPNFTVTNTSPSSGGTVTSVSALTLGTSGTDLSSTVANSTTTPVITLNVPTASATNRGALSSTDWSTFNSKAPGVTFTTSYVPYGQGTTTLNQASNFTFDGTTQTAPIQRASNGIIVNSKTVSANYTIASGDSAMSTGPITVASGISVTVSSGSRWVVL